MAAGGRLAGVCSRRVEDASAPRCWAAVGELAERAVASPATSSMGRLFDAVAALCGGPLRVSYEGQAAVELEALAAGAGATAAVPYPLDLTGEPVMDPRSTVAAVAADVAAGVPPATVAARFHETIARSTADARAGIGAARGLGTVVLSGGVFQNRLLLARTIALPRRPMGGVALERLPANDGGIAYGQAAIAAAWLSGGTARGRRDARAGEEEEPQHEQHERHGDADHHHVQDGPRVACRARRAWSGSRAGRRARSAWFP